MNNTTVILTSIDKHDFVCLQINCGLMTDKEYYTLRATYTEASNCINIIVLIVKHYLQNRQKIMKLSVPIANELSLDAKVKENMFREMFDRDELIEIRIKAQWLGSVDGVNPDWQRALYNLATAADHLDAMIARCTQVEETIERTSESQKDTHSNVSTKS
jgi:hypothetical protein